MVSVFSDCSQNDVDQSRCLMGSPGVLVALLTTASQFYFLIGFLPFSSAFNWRDHTYYNAFLHFYFILFLQLEWIFWVDLIFIRDMIYIVDLEWLHSREATTREMFVCPLQGPLTWQTLILKIFFKTCLTWTLIDTAYAHLKQTFSLKEILFPWNFITLKNPNSASLWNRG